jgi:hypothetical protein
MPVSLERFQVAVDRLAELRREGLARLVFGPESQVAVAIDPSAENVPPGGDGLFAEVFDVFNAIARGASVELFVTRHREQRGQSEDEDLLRAKYAAVAAAFPADELQRRTAFRLTSKVPVLVGVDWDIVVKEHDSLAPETRSEVANPEQHVPFSHLRLVIDPAFGPIQEVVVALDLEDVEDLVEDIERLKTRLAGTIQPRSASHTTHEDESSTSTPSS